MIKHRTQRLAALVFGLIIAFAAHTAPSAAQIMAAVKANFTSSAAVEALFTINGGDGAVQGSVQIAGPRFNLSTPQLHVWYDGKTQWTYLNSSNEVSISEPTAEELTAANPFAVLSEYARYYNCRTLRELNGLQRIELTPKANDGGISRVVLCVDKKNWPSVLTIVFDDNRTVVVDIDSIKGRNALPENTFRYDAKLHPAAEIIDLR